MARGWFIARCLRPGVLWITIILVALRAGPGVASSFLALWLHGKGMPAHSIGLLIALPLILRPLSAPAFGWWAASFADMRKPIALLSAVIVVVALALNGTGGFWGLLLVLSALMTVLGALVSVVDTAALVGCRMHRYSIAMPKAMAASAAIFAGIVLGNALDRSGPIVIPYWIAGFALAGCLGIAVFDRKTPLRDPASDDSHPAILEHDDKKREPVFVRKSCDNRNLEREGGSTQRHHALESRARLPTAGVVLVILAGTLVQTSHGMNATVMLLWQQRGFSALQCSLLWQAGAAADVGLLWVLSKVRIAPIVLLGVGAAASVVRWAGFALSPPLAGLYALQALHAFSFTATNLGCIQLVDRPHDRPRGIWWQVLSGALTTGLGTALGALASGALVEYFGVDAYWVMAAVAACAMVPVAIILRWSMSAKEARL